MDQLNSILGYITIDIQPLFGLLIGTFLLAFVAYINWYGTLKKDVIKWIASYIFRNAFRSEVSADSLFMVTSSFTLCIGGIWIILAFLYLSSGIK
jgi:uncharacterized membrane protein